MSKWYSDHVKDPYVRKAQQDGYRSRAVYKLAEISERERLLKRGMLVLDLGCAPGGWCQYCVSQVRPGGRVVGVDLLDMEPIDGVTFIRGDFTDEPTLQAVRDELAGPADLVISDMAPNLSGVRSVDLPKAMYLAELALDCAREVLKPGGSFVTKLFHGEGFDDYVKLARACFGTVKVRKPKASRARSRETYLLARSYRL